MQPNIHNWSTRVKGYDNVPSKVTLIRSNRRDVLISHLELKDEPETKWRKRLGDDEGVVDVAIATVSIVICLLLAATIFALTATSTRINDAAVQVARNEARAIERSNTYLNSASLQQIATDTVGSLTSISISTEAIALGGTCPSEYYAIYVKSQQLPFITSSMTETVPIGLNLGGCQ